LGVYGQAVSLDCSPVKLVLEPSTKLMATSYATYKNISVPTKASKHSRRRRKKTFGAVIAIRDPKMKT